MVEQPLPVKAKKAVEELENLVFNTIIDIDEFNIAVALSVINLVKRNFTTELLIACYLRQLPTFIDQTHLDLDLGLDLDLDQQSP